VEIRFVETGQLLTARDGELYGALQIRDVTIPDIDGRLDQVAAGIIEQINLVHSRGNGIADYSGSLISTNSVTDPTLALNAAGLPFTVNAGSFEVNVYDNTGTPVGGSPFTVNINAATTLNDVAAALNGIPNLTASVTVDGNLQVDGAPGFTYSFGNDDTGVLGAVGVNVLFTGFDARSIGVNQDIVNDPRLLASAFSVDPLDTGDNAAALAMAAVQEGLFFLGGTSTINDFYESTIVQIGVDARANRANLEVERSFVEEFDRRRQEVSGVSIDEEATLLIQYQRAFEASARVVTVTDRMLESLLTMAL
jgi:flagellar hook-associated protein 1 FlgK